MQYLLQRMFLGLAKVAVAAHEHVVFTQRTPAHVAFPQQMALAPEHYIIQTKNVAVDKLRQQQHDGIVRMLAFRLVLPGLLHEHAVHPTVPRVLHAPDVAHGLAKAHVVVIDQKSAKAHARGVRAF